MKKLGLAQLLAKHTNISTGMAADELDSVVHDILKNLRKGRIASVPGLGKFLMGKDSLVRFERTRGK